MNHDDTITGSRPGLASDLTFFWTCRRDDAFYTEISGICASAMTLPDRLLKQMMPAELELIASEHLVEIVPLISMERTAFISVRLTLNNKLRSLIESTGSLWSLAASCKVSSAIMDGDEFEAEEEVPHRPTRLAQRRYVSRY